MSYIDKPWLKSYKLGPYKLDHSLEPYPKEPVSRALEGAAQKFPNQSAIQYLDRDIKYHQLNNQADKLAAALVRLGVRKGDRVCLFLPNCIEFALSDWAVLKAGAAVVPTSVLRTEQGLLYEVSTSGSKVVICKLENLEQVLSLKSHSDIEHIIVTSSRGYDVERISKSLPKGVIELRSLLDEHDPIPLEIEIDTNEDLCELAFTGGATGIPKGVMITHANRYSCILQGFPWLLKPVQRGFLGKASVLIAIPVFHAYGHYILQSAAHLGLRVLLLPDPRDSKMLIEYIQRFRPFLIPVVPTQLMRISQTDLGRMNVLPMSGSAPLPLEVGEAIQKKLGMPVSEGYGLTETSPITHFNVSSFSKITGFMSQVKPGIGIPSPDTECMLVEPGTRSEVPFGAAGEILVRGPQIMKGYWPQAGSGLAEDGWLRTGDIGVMDEDGYFQIVDRIKDMVNISGMKVYTTKVDDILYRHPGVLMAAAIGIPDVEKPGSERVMAVIQLREGYSQEKTETELIELCREYLPPYALPKYFRFTSAMPLTVTEKVYKKTLRDEALERIRETGEP